MKGGHQPRSFLAVAQHLVAQCYSLGEHPFARLEAADFKRFLLLDPWRLIWNSLVAKLGSV